MRGDSYSQPVVLHLYVAVARVVGFGGGFDGGSVLQPFLMWVIRL